MTIRAVVIGIGSGHPDHLTGEARRAMNEVDLFLVADKGATKRDLAALRIELCRTVIDHDHYRIVEVPDPARTATDGYESGVRDWHAARAAAYAAVIDRERPEGGTVGFLVWGDPSLYDSTIRIAAALPGAELTVIPGISSVQLLAARHKIILNRVGQSVHVTTGRRLLAEYSPELGDVLVMLDGDLTCAALVDDHPELIIFWGAQLGLPDEALRTGPLATMIDEIAETRDRIRAARGWVMDTYLLRPGAP